MPTAPDTTLLAAALTYARRGWHVFPCHTPHFHGSTVKCSCRDPACPAMGKHPRTKHGFNDATTDAATIRRWWSTWPDANIGIATGARSGLVVIDEDPYRGGDLSALTQHYDPLPEAPEVLTGHGRHIYLAYPGHYIRSRRNAFGPAFPGLDIRADSGHVIAPPSLHVSGRQYRWEITHDPDDIPLPPVPAWFLASQSIHSPSTIATSKDQYPAAVSLLASVPEGEVVFPYAGPVTQADLIALLRRWDVVERVLPLLGLAGRRLRQKFCCVLHPDQHASAALYPPREGHAEDMYVYLDFHGSDRAVWPLPVIYWAVKTGQAPRQLPTPTLVTWTVRLLMEAAVLTPAEVRAPKLPDDVPAFVRVVYEGFVRLMQCKWRLKEAPSPYTWAFIVDWTRTAGFTASKDLAGQAMKFVLSRGFLIMARIENGCQCFLFGSHALRQRLKQRVGVAVQQTQKGIVAAVQKVAAALWADPAAAPCPSCGRTVYAPDACPECLGLLNARLYRKRATLGPCANPP